VTRLHRESALGPGQITVKGYVEGLDSGQRSLKVELDEVRIMKRSQLMTMDTLSILELPSGETLDRLR